MLAGSRLGRREPATERSRAAGLAGVAAAVAEFTHGVVPRLAADHTAGHGLDSSGSPATAANHRLARNFYWSDAADRLGVVETGASGAVDRSTEGAFLVARRFRRRLGRWVRLADGQI